MKSKRSKVYIVAAVCIILFFASVSFVLGYYQNVKEPALLEGLLKRPREFLNKVEETVKETEYKGSFRDIISKGDDVICTFELRDAGDVKGAISGEIYLAGGKKARIDILTFPDDAASSASTYLIDGEYMYLWTDNSGFMAELSDNKTILSSEYLDMNEYVDVLDKTVLSCDPWIVDENAFKVPDTVEFDFYAKHFNKIFDEVKKEHETYCSGCNGLFSEELVARCKEYRGCN